VLQKKRKCDELNSVADVKKKLGENFAEILVASSTALQVSIFGRKILKAL